MPALLTKLMHQKQACLQPGWVYSGLVIEARRLVPGRVSVPAMLALVFEQPFTRICRLFLVGVADRCVLFCFRPAMGAAADPRVL